MGDSNEFKVVFVGCPGVGKTSIIHACLGKPPPEDESDEPFEMKTHKMSYRGRDVALKLFDTAGQERFRQLTSSYYRKAAACIYVYDLTSDRSLTDLEDFCIECEHYTSKSCVGFLVANKIDLESKRQVTKEKGLKFAAKRDLSANFVEVSAKTGAGVMELFDSVCKLVMEKKAAEMGSSIEQSGSGKKKKTCVLV